MVYKKRKAYDTQEDNKTEVVVLSKEISKEEEGKTNKKKIINTINISHIEIISTIQKYFSDKFYIELLDTPI